MAYPDYIPTGLGKNEVTHFEELIDNLIQFHPGPFKERDYILKFRNIENNVETKIAFLEGMIQSWKFHRRTWDSEIEFDDYLAGNIFINNDLIRVSLEIDHPTYPRGIPSHYYQPALLSYMLTTYVNPKPILEVIRGFIDLHREKLSIKDFEKTKTGATRCITNIRKAAHQLSEFGLLRHTQKSPMKTWRLSIVGFFTALFLVTFNDSNISPEENGDYLRKNIYDLNLHPSIHQFFTNDDNELSYIDRLLELGISNREMLQDHKALKTISDTRIKCKGLLTSTDLKNPEKKRTFHALVRELENDLAVRDYMGKLEACIEIDRITAHLGISRSPY